MKTTTIYLIHFDRPLSHARHYLGSTALPTEERLAEHRAGRGAKFTMAAAAAGIEFEVVRTWKGDRWTEAKMKGHGKNGRRTGSSHSWKAWCPVCKQEKKSG